MKKYTSFFALLFFETFFLVLLGSLGPLATMGAESFFKYDSRVFVLRDISVPFLLWMLGYELFMGVLFLFFTEKFITEKQMIDLRNERLIYWAHLMIVFVYLQTLWMTLVCYLCSPFIGFRFTSEIFVILEKVLILPVWVMGILYLARGSLSELYKEREKPSFVTILDAP